MTASVKYLLDADTFIRAYRHFYSPSFCPAYWDAILRHHATGKLASIEQIKKELLKGKDELALWIKDECPESFFKQTKDVKVMRAYSDIMKWAQSRTDVNPAAKEKFADGADGWLVAYANVNRYVVCTLEVSAPDAKSNIKLPDVANHFNVACETPFEMLNSLAVRMVLAKRKRK